MAHRKDWAIFSTSMLFGLQLKNFYSVRRFYTITSTPYAVLPLFATRFAACTGGHLGHFHRAISHLKWYKIVCMRYLACTLRWNLLTCFPCFCNLEFPGISFENILWFEYITSLFSCLCISMLTSNSSDSMQKHGYLGCFHAESTRENISWGWIIVCTRKNIWRIEEYVEMWIINLRL